jgi:hypothetical protein
VAPQTNAIQAKYKDDKRRRQREIVKFYRENDIKPFASSLPLVAQIPVFIGLFYTLRTRLREDICPGLQAAFRHADAADHHLPLPDAAGQTVACHGLNRSSWLFIHDLTSTAAGVHPGRADRALRRHAARVKPDDAGADPRPGTAAAAAAAAPGGVRDLHRQLPGRVDPLLDHHEHLADRAAVGDPEKDRAGRPGDPGRARPLARRP